MTDTRNSIKTHLEEAHARIHGDVQKLQEMDEFNALTGMVKCYIDILILDIEHLMERDKISHNHIDDLNEMLDTKLSHTL